MLSLRSRDLSLGGTAINRQTGIVSPGFRETTPKAEVDCVPPTDAAILKAIDYDLTRIIVERKLAVWSQRDLTEWFRSAEAKDSSVINMWVKKRCEAICKTNGIKRTPKLKVLWNETDETYTLGRADCMKLYSIW